VEESSPSFVEIGESEVEEGGVLPPDAEIEAKRRGHPPIVKVVVVVVQVTEAVGSWWRKKPPSFKRQEWFGAVSFLQQNFNIV